MWSTSGMLTNCRSLSGNAGSQHSYRRAGAELIAVGKSLLTMILLLKAGSSLSALGVFSQTHLSTRMLMKLTFLET